MNERVPFTVGFRDSPGFAIFPPTLQRFMVGHAASVQFVNHYFVCSAQVAAIALVTMRLEVIHQIL